VIEVDEAAVAEFVLPTRNIARQYVCVYVYFQH
jgi:hypothetical protein